MVCWFGVFCIIVSSCCVVSCACLSISCAFSVMSVIVLVSGFMKMNER